MDELSFQEYLSYAWENLWFMRPDWLYAFIPIGALAILFVILGKQQQRWKRMFPKAVIPFLTIKGTKRQFIWPRLLLIVFLSLLTIAAAGPTWEQIERPGQKTEAALVILMDVSRSMLAEDIQPNRLERAKLKMKDFFAAGPSAKAALIAYAGTAHSVVPFSKDYKTIARQMDALRPDIMPVSGSYLEEAFDLADSLLLDVIAPSTILLVTDKIEQDDIARISQSAVNTHVEVIAIATPNGGTIPNRNSVLKDKQGNTVIPRLDVIALDQLKTVENVNVVTVTLDASDVQILAARVRQNLEFEIDLENAEDEWKDMGIWLVFPSLLIALLWFRRGWKVHWVLLILVSLSCDDAGEFSLQDQFFTADQRAELKKRQGKDGEAAATYESGDQKGYAYYQLGDLEAAAQAYSEDVSAEGFYNLGVIYAEMGDLEAAEQAFNSALELDPDMEVAQRNRDQVVIVRDSIAAVEGLEISRSEKNDFTPKELNEYDESSQGDDKDQALDSDEKYEGQGDIQEMVTTEVDENTIDVFEFDENIVIDKDAAKQTLLRQVTEDPSLFLRRKFAYQIKNRKKPIIKSEDSW